MAYYREGDQIFVRANLSSYNSGKLYTVIGHYPKGLLHVYRTSRILLSEISIPFRAVFKLDPDTYLLLPDTIMEFEQGDEFWDGIRWIPVERLFLQNTWHVPGRRKIVK